MIEYRSFRNTDPPRLVDLWNAALPNRGAVALKVASLHFHPSGFSADGGATVGGQAPSETHRAHGLVGTAAARPGDAGNRQRALRLRVLQCALRHSAGHRLAHRAVVCHQGRIHAQQFGLGFVGIAHKATLEPGARTCKIGAGGGDHAACAAFGCGNACVFFR